MVTKKKSKESKNSGGNSTVATKKMQRIALPPMHVFGTQRSSSTNVERGQIEQIKLTTGSGKSAKEFVIYENGEFADGLHPDQAEFIINVIAGGTGNARGGRQLGFAAWIASVLEMHGKKDVIKNVLKYTAHIFYKNRGGKMAIPVEDLAKVCELRAEWATESWELYPREAEEVEAKEPKDKTVEVAVTL